jgi:hypothetical protein
MPSIRVLLAFVFPRTIGSFHEPTPGEFSGQQLGVSGLNQDMIGGMHRAKSFSVEYNRNTNRDDATFVHLMDMPGGTSSKSIISIEGKSEKATTYGGCLV